jgi:ubiquinone/menaquinone biosynthesis C-methylase UbiE
VEFTGERYFPELDSPEIGYSHWHRYLYACQFTVNKVVLDIACGEGYGSHLFAQTAYKVIGVDIDEETISHAASKYQKENLSFIVGSVSDIPIVENSFDTIISFETIEHITENLQREFLHEVKRLLKKDGTFLISTPNRLFCGDVPVYTNKFHVKEFYPDEFKELLSNYFKNIVLLGHNLYAGSYIWNPECTTTDFLELDIEFTEKGFSPARDGKYILYMIAVCSDNEISDLRPSLLIDLSQRVYKLRLEETAKLVEKEQQLKTLKEQQIALLQSLITEKEQQLKTLEEQLSVISPRQNS